MFRPILVVVFAILIVMLLVVTSPASAGENEQQQQIDLKQARFSDCVVFLACGAMRSETGVIYQVRLDGTKKPNSVTVPGQAENIAITADQTLYGVITNRGGPFGADGHVFQVDRTGAVKMITKMSSPTDIAIDPSSGKVIIADQWDDTTYELEPATGQLDEYLPAQVPKRHGRIPGLFLNFTGYGDILMSSTAPKGIFFTSGGSEPTDLLGEKMLVHVGHCSSDPQSAGRWAATQPKAVHIFEGNKEVVRIRYPSRTTVYYVSKTWHSDRSLTGGAGGRLAFGPEGNIVIPLYHQEEDGTWKCLIYRLNLAEAEKLLRDKKSTEDAWDPLFSWHIEDANPTATAFSGILVHPPHPVGY